MSDELVRYEADGLAMVSHLYLPKTASDRRAPGVLVFPEAFGLGDHAKSRAERLAALGYVALACDIHGDGKIIGSLDEIMAVLGRLSADPSRTRARAQGGLSALAARDEVDASRIASIGFCFGGTLSLELARSGADIRGVVSFHGGLSTAAPDASKVKAKVLVCTGADDPGIPVEQRNAFEAEMRAANIDWQMHVYGGVVHSFTNPEADKLGQPDFARYDASADARSWASMRAFFDEIF